MTLFLLSIKSNRFFKQILGSVLGLVVTNLSVTQGAEDLDLNWKKKLEGVSPSRVSVGIVQRIGSGVPEDTARKALQVSEREVRKSLRADWKKSPPGIADHCDWEDILCISQSTRELQSGRPDLLITQEILTDGENLDEVRIRQSLINLHNQQVVDSAPELTLPVEPARLEEVMSADRNGLVGPVLRPALINLQAQAKASGPSPQPKSPQSAHPTQSPKNNPDALEESTSFDKLPWLKGLVGLWLLLKLLDWLRSLFRRRSPDTVGSYGLGQLLRLLILAVLLALVLKALTLDYSTIRSGIENQFSGMAWAPFFPISEYIIFVFAALLWVWLLLRIVSLYLPTVLRPFASLDRFLHLFRVTLPKAIFRIAWTSPFWGIAFFLTTRIPFHESWSQLPLRDSFAFLLLINLIIWGVIFGMSLFLKVTVGSTGELKIVSVNEHSVSMRQEPLNGLIRMYGYEESRASVNSSLWTDPVLCQRVAYLILYDREQHFDLLEFPLRKLFSHLPFLKRFRSWRRPDLENEQYFINVGTRSTSGGHDHED